MNADHSNVSLASASEPSRGDTAQVQYDVADVTVPLLLEKIDGGARANSPPLPAEFRDTHSNIDDEELGEKRKPRTNLREAGARARWASGDATHLFIGRCTEPKTICVAHAQFGHHFAARSDTRPMDIETD